MRVKFNLYKIIVSILLYIMVILVKHPSFFIANKNNNLQNKGKYLNFLNYLLVNAVLNKGTFY